MNEPLRTIIPAILLVMVASMPAFSQNPDIKRTWHWYFGDKAGLDFSSGSPVAVPDGQMTAASCHASVSDENGNLLFYSDGWNAWNRNHQLMPNGTGLVGDFGSDGFRNTLAVQKPGNDNIHYLFYWQYDSTGTNSDFVYSIIDMGMDGGLGDVVSKQNITGLKSPMNGMGAVRHENGEDVWVVAMKLGTDTFYSYLLSESGLDLTPVKSKAGILGNHTMYNIKFSPDGTKMGVTFNLDGYEILDFDKSTGMVFNPIVFPPCNCEPFGVEFSPNGKRVYFTVFYYDIVPKGGGALYQVSLEGDSLDIINSKILLDTIEVNDTITSYIKLNTIFGIQLASDGKIYATHALKPKLSAINNPNEEGLACNFMDSVVSLQGRNAALGFPLFLADYFYDPAYYVASPGISIENEKLRVSPNPFRLSAKVEVLEAGFSGGEVVLYNMMGQEVRRRRIAGKEFLLQREGLSPGTYLVKISPKMGESLETQIVITNE